MAFRILVDRHHHERLAEAEEHRLAATATAAAAATATTAARTATAARSATAPPRASEARARVGEWLVRAGESLGGEPVRRRV